MSIPYHSSVGFISLIERIALRLSGYGKNPPSGAYVLLAHKSALQSENWMNNTRTSFCIALLAAAIAASCAEHEPTGPGATDARIAPVGQVTGDQFFVAWSAFRSYQTDPIQTQIYGMDSRQYRQMTGFTADSGVLAFASANPGKLYINGDEPDVVCTSAYDYAAVYHDYVVAVRAADPTARFSPAGISDPADHCCPTPGEPCRTNMHWVSYADQFYNSYVQRYGVAPPVDEWRFHNFAQWIGPGDVTTWWAQVRDAAAWSVAHGAPMVLGSWGFIGWRVDAEYPLSEYLGNMRQSMDSLRNDPRISQAVWWAYEQTCCLDDGTPYRHHLWNSDGHFTPEGLTYGNIRPTGLFIQVGPAQMRGVWNNMTTNTMATNGAAIEVQFFKWMTFYWEPTSGPMWQPPGAIMTQWYGFPSGARVRFWARYMTAHGPGPWSVYSSAVTIP
jgi:hypothetical protein